MQSKRTWAGALVLVAVVSALGQENKPGEPEKEKPRPVTDVEGKSLSQWIIELRNPDASQREHAISVLPLFGANAGSSEIVGLLLDRCQDKDASPRIRAVMVLNSLDIKEQDRPRVVTGLTMRLLNDDQAIIRYYAIVGLKRFGEEARPAISALASCSRDPVTWEIRRASLACLALCGKTSKGTADPRATSAFVNASKDATAEVRLEAAMGLGMTGKSTDDKLGALPETALKNLTHDRDKRVAIWAQVSQMALHGTNAATMDNIAKELKATDVKVRISACKAIGAMGKNAKAIQGNVMDALNDKDTSVQMAAIMALSSMEDRGATVLTALKEIGNDKKADDFIRQAALSAHDYLRRGVEKPLPKK